MLKKMSNALRRNVRNDGTWNTRSKWKAISNGRNGTKRREKTIIKAKTQVKIIAYSMQEAVAAISEKCLRYRQLRAN